MRCELQLGELPQTGVDSEMKRSPPPQRKTPMPRCQNRLSVRSKKNSKPHRCASVITEYRASHPDCFRCGFPRNHIHHLFKGSRSRVDHAANIIGVCGGCHEIDDRFPVQFKIECMHGKLEMNEFDQAALSTIAGEFIVGWLARHEQPAGEIETMRQRLLSVCVGSGD